MTFVRSQDPTVVQNAIKVASEQKWKAPRDQDVGKFGELVRLKYCRTGPGGKTRDFNGTLPEYTNPRGRDSPSTQSEFECLPRTIVRFTSGGVSRPADLLRGGVAPPRCKTFPHYHQERSHQGLENRLISPGDDAGRDVGAIESRKRLGDLLRDYHRCAA